ncbi:hypothetical protein JCM10212_000937 [Sporobolomyces blumeae]
MRPRRRDLVTRFGSLGKDAQARLPAFTAIGSSRTFDERGLSKPHASRGGPTTQSRASEPTCCASPPRSLGFGADRLWASTTSNSTGGSIANTISDAVNYVSETVQEYTAGASKEKNKEIAKGNTDASLSDRVSAGFSAASDKSAKN